MISAMADPLDPQVPSEKPQPSPAAPPKSGPSIGSILAAPFVAVGRLVHGKSKIDEMIVYCAPPAFFLWVVILVGFVLNLLCPKIVTPGAGAWVFIFTLIYFILALLYDMSLKKLILCSLVVAVLWLFAKYMESLHNIVILGAIMKYFAALNPQFDNGTVSVICWLLLIPWVASLFEMVFNRKKKFSPNEIAEYHFGEGSELTDRTGLRFMTKYRDVLETLLGFGGGDLIAVDNQQRVIKRYENIVGLWFKWDKLDRILQQRSILVDAEEEEKPEDPKPAV
jgi:hypothetical protein